MKKQDLLCMDCGKLTEHLLKGKDGVYDAICRVCKRKSGVAMSDSVDNQGKEF